MGAPARAFWLTLLAYVVIGGILLAKTGGPTATPPSESVASTTNASANASTNATPTGNGTGGGPTAENLTNGVAQPPGGQAAGP